MRVATLALITGTLMAAATPANATTVYEEEFTCPIGGEKFTATVIGSTYSGAQRPDGKPLDGVGPWPLVECPENGLVLFQEEFTDREFTEAEKTVLAEAIATQEYKRMRQEDTPYRRLWWLQQKLGAEPLDLAFALMLASWETDDNPQRKQRYQDHFAQEAQKINRTDDNANAWFDMTITAVNALRETEQWDEAEALLNTIDDPALYPREKGDAGWAGFMIAGLRSLIAEGNPTSMPTNLLDPQNAAFRCLDEAHKLSTSEEEACNTPEYKEAQQNVLEYRQREEAASGPSPADVVEAVEAAPAEASPAEALEAVESLEATAAAEAALEAAAADQPK